MQSKLLENEKLKKKKKCDLIGNKIFDIIIRLSRSLPQNSSETVTNKTEDIGIHRDIPQKISLSSKKAASFWWFESNIRI